MQISRDTLSVKEMDEIIGIQSKIREYHDKETDVVDEEVIDFTQRLNTTLTTLITLSQRRKTKLMKLLSHIERERSKLLASTDSRELSTQTLTEKTGRLEKMINEYFCLNEGLKYSRKNMASSLRRAKK
jgi:hypothetical protein